MISAENMNVMERSYRKDTGIKSDIGMNED